MSSLQISPDLGRPNLEDLFDGTNEIMAEWALADLDQVVTAPAYTKSRYTLIFEHSGVRYKLPESALAQLGSGKHFWRAAGGLIQEFVFVRNAPPPAELPELVPESDRILN